MLENNDYLDVDLREPEIQRNPFDVYKFLRDKNPVCQIKNGLWVISCYKDVKYALLNPDIFSSKANNLLFDSDWLSKECRNPRLIAAQDPPEHTKYQAVIKQAFTKASINKLKPLMRETADSILDTIAPEKTFDFVEQVAFPYIGKLARNLVGIDEYQSLDELREWIILEGSNSPTRPSDKYIKAFTSAVIRQNNYFKKVLNNRRSQPQSDLATHLVNVKVDGKLLTDMELCSLLSLVVSAALVGTVQTLNHCIRELSNHPDLYISIKNDRNLIPVFLEEVLRYCTPAHSAFRKTVKPANIAGVVIPKDSLVLLLLASANRDPQIFDRPEIFNIYRDKLSQHLAFGYGVHRCLGATLGSIEIQIMLDAVFDRFNCVNCIETNIEWLDSGFMRGFSKLPTLLSL